MFGVIVCRDPRSTSTVQHVVLKAFSGQMTNFWHVPGWVGPVAAIINASPLYQDYRTLTEAYSARLAAVEVALRQHPQHPQPKRPQPKRQQPNSPSSLLPTSSNDAPAATAAFLASQRRLLRSRRKALSHELLRRIQDSYRPTNLRGQPLSLLRVYDTAQRLCRTTDGTASLVTGGSPGGVRADGGAAVQGFVASEGAVEDGRGYRGAESNGAGLAFPAGTGDCCAPKLLWAAAQAGLVPLGLVEFWYGSPPNTATPQGRRAGAGAGGSSSGAATMTRVHGEMYGMCDKCEMILGSMLCGLDELRAGP